MYKPYARPHLDYGNIIYHDQNMLLSRKLESIQYEAALAVSGAWKDTNTERFLGEIGWETLSKRRWYRRLCLFYNIVNNQAPRYLGVCLPSENRRAYQLRQANVFIQDSCSSYGIDKIMKHDPVRQYLISKQLFSQYFDHQQPPLWNNKQLPFKT